MAKSSKLRVIISSRCTDSFPAAGGRPLSEIRKELKQKIETLEVFGRKVFEVWINEETPPQGGTWDSWDVCLRAVKDCDILISLCNGNAGWANKSDAGGIGICHAELMTAMSQAPAKVRLVALPNLAITKTADGKRNQRFQDYVAENNRFRGATVATEIELNRRVEEALGDALIALAQSGVGESSKARFSSGQALDWSRLDFRLAPKKNARRVARYDARAPGIRRRRRASHCDARGDSGFGSSKCYSSSN